MCDMMGGMMGGMGAWMILWGILGLVLLGLAVAGAVWLVRSLSRGPSSALPPEDRAQAELRHRYAIGEIDREEYLQRKVDLE